MNARALTAAAAILAAAALSACTAMTEATGGPTGREPITPSERYAIEVTRTPDDVALAPHAEGLSPAQRDALDDFVHRWRANEGGEVSVRAPADARDPVSAQRTAESAAAYLRRQGVPAAELHLAIYQAGSAGAPVVASYMSYQAHGPDCAHTWDNLASTGSNLPSRHFGCTVTANFAAQIANAKDLVGPARLDPADNTRRENVLNKYRRGETTSSAKDDQASGTVSNAVH